MKATDRVFAAAKFFRLFLQKELPLHLSRMPEAEPLGGLKHKAPFPFSEGYPKALACRFPEILSGAPEPLAEFPSGP